MAVVEFIRDMQSEHYEFHPIADIFPLMEGAELRQLTESILGQGLLEPVLMYQNKVLDGRNRIRACQAACISPRFDEFAGTDEEAIAHVWALNRARRHLNSSQAAIADAKRARMLDVYAPVKQAAAERAHEGRRKGGETAGRGREKQDNSLRQLIAPTNSEIEANKTRSIRAAAAGTNRQYINVADRLIEEHPEYVIAIESGEKTITQVQRELRQHELRKYAPDAPAGKYRVIYADPPWRYNDTQAISKNGMGENYGPADAHYPQMSINELCALPISGIAEDNAVLFLWTTSPLLESAFVVINAWGFKYKTSFVWDKIKHNMGHYNSVRHEFLLVCTRGSCTPDEAKLFDSVQSIDRSQRHSEKPQAFRDIIDTLYTRGEKIELFARTQHDGWNAWGNEAGSAPQ